MDVNFDAVINDLDDKPVRMSAQDDTVVTLKHLARVALTELDPRNPDAPDKKLRCFDLALRVKDGGVVKLLPEEATLIKERIGAIYAPVIFGRAAALLNG